MRAGRILIALAATAAIAAPAAAAAPSDLDTGFGDGGTRLARNILGGIGESGTAFGSLRLLPDGRIVALFAQRCSEDCSEQVVARYTPSGVPDPTLGGDGAVAFPGTDGDFTDRRATGLAIGGDGAMAFGYTGDTDGPRLERVAPHGVRTSVTRLPGAVTPLALLPDGRVLVFRDGRALLLREDGTPDQALGVGEGVPVPAAGPVLAAIAGDEFVVVGTDLHGIVYARIPLDGSDVVRAYIPLRRPTGDRPFSSVVPVELGIAEDGRARVLVETFRLTPGNRGLRQVIGAFDRLGRVDRTFGDGGVVSLGDRRSRIAVQRNGKVVVLRTGGTAGRPLLIVRRLDARGRPDATFAVRRLSSVAKDVVGHDVEVDRRGRIVVGAGAFTEYGSSGLLLVRLRGGEVAPRLPLTSAQLRVSQRIAQAALRRLAAVEARLAGAPPPAPPGAGAPAAVRLSLAQLRVNQRIAQAAIRRAERLEAILEGGADEAPPPRGGTAGRLELTSRQLLINLRIAQAAVRRANVLNARVPA